ncbi:AAA family ATPase [Oscillibacter hominis]|uniref:AAA family ATPase n=1 Tax=Oscillibacter hominis TaxID=2763056 RepID=A0A7G9B7N1_9FIRM|nr:AAA family ATPase [Oscillibacter hominis]QNL45562.1 AAA family ATPase [Oscillibacter hominis]
MNFLAQIKLRKELPEDSYLLSLAPVRYLMEGHVLSFDRPVTFFVGENGTGKSTLLEAIAVSCGFNAEGGTRNFRFSTNDTHSVLGEYLTPARRSYPKDGFFLRAESFYNVATNIDQMDAEFSFGPRLIDSYGGVSLHRQSHGESFLALVQNRFRGNGLYLLDEPEAALSPSKLLVLLAEMHRLVEAGSQFVIATHSPILMAYPGAQLYEMSSVRPVAYQETEHYQLTRQFLNHPEQMLHYLLEE